MPACGTERDAPQRHPRAVCDGCKRRTVDAYGRRLAFYNASLSGGLMAVEVETGEERDDTSECFIDGAPCRAEEGRLGGVFVSPADSKPL